MMSNPQQPPPPDFSSTTSLWPLPLEDSAKKQHKPRIRKSKSANLPGAKLAQTEHEMKTKISLPGAIHAMSTNGGRRIAPTVPSAGRVPFPIGRAASDGLDRQIQNLFLAHQASPLALSARHELISRLNLIFNSTRFSWGHSHSALLNPILVEPFGSTRFGLTTSSSDLDLCLLDPYRPNGFSEKFFRTAEKEEKDLPDIYNMKRIERVLRENGFGKVTAIQWAKVPICKFEARIGGIVIQADLNTNERFGVLNSSLLNSYMSLHPLFRPLAVFLKTWFRSKSLNDPAGSQGLTTFSSYSIILLLISYLQKKKGLVNLQDENLIQVFGIEERRFWSRPKQVLKYTKIPGGGKGKEVKAIQNSVGWNTTFVSSDLYGQLEGEAANWGTLKELVVGFFEHYLEEYETEKEIVAVAEGGKWMREVEFTTFGRNKEKKEGDKKQQQPIATLNGEQPQPEPEPAQEADGEPDDDALASLSLDNASRSSSPVLISQSESHEQNNDQWKYQKLVIQDPFIRSRNTCLNISDGVVDLLWKEMKVTLHALRQGCETVEELMNVGSEEGMESLRKKNKNAGGRKDGVVAGANGEGRTPGNNRGKRNRQNQREKKKAAEQGGNVPTPTPTVALA